MLTRSCLLLVAALIAASGGWASGSRLVARAPQQAPIQVPGGQRGQPPPAPPIGTAFLAGQVVEQLTGHGVAGASVALLGRGMPVGRGGSPLQVVADSQGRFFFSNLPAGSYQTQVGKAGYSPASLAATSRLVDLADGERFTDVKIRMVKTASLSGAVRDDGGDPVVGSNVIAFRRTLINGRPTLRPAGPAQKTDDRGAYRLSNLPPGDYIICACGGDPVPFDNVLLTTLAADPLQLMAVAARALTVGADAASLDSTLRTFAPTFYPNSATTARATRVTVASGEEKTDIDFDVTATRFTRLSGTIVGAIGPVQASSMRLVPAGESEEGVAFAALMPILVQPDGRFDFVGVPPGQYVLRVVHTPTDGRGGGAMSGAALGFLGARGAGAGQPGGSQLPNEPPLWAAEPVTVGENGVAGFSITLRRATSLSGRVQFVGAAPQPTPQQLQQSAIIPQPVSVDPSGLGFGNVGRLNPDATFRIPGILPGRYSLTALGTAGWPTLKSIVVAGVDVTDLPIEVEANEISDVVITLVDTPMATLSGALAGSQTTSGGDTSILVFPTDRRYWADPAAGRRRFRSSPVNLSGSFTVSGLPAGEYFVVAVLDDAANEWQEVSQLETFARTAQRAQLADGEKKTLEVKR